MGILDKGLVRTTLEWAPHPWGLRAMNFYGVLPTFLPGSGSSSRQGSH